MLTKTCEHTWIKPKPGDVHCNWCGITPEDAKEETDV